MKQSGNSCNIICDSQLNIHSTHKATVNPENYRLFFVMSIHGEFQNKILAIELHLFSNKT